MSVNMKGLKYHYLIIITNTKMPSHLRCDVRQFNCPEEVTATVGVTMPTMTWGVSGVSGQSPCYQVTEQLTVMTDGGRVDSGSEVVTSHLTGMSGINCWVSCPP